MGAIKTSLAFGAGALVGAAALLAHQISHETGRSLADSISLVPEEAAHLYEQLKSKALQMLDGAGGAYAGRGREVSEDPEESSADVS